MKILKPLDDRLKRRDVADRMTWILTGSTIWTVIVANLPQDFTYLETVAFGSLLFVASTTYDYGVHLRIFEKLWNWKLKNIVERVDGVLFR